MDRPAAVSTPIVCVTDRRRGACVAKTAARSDDPMGGATMVPFIEVELEDSALPGSESEAGLPEELPTELGSIVPAIGCLALGFSREFSD